MLPHASIHQLLFNFAVAAAALLAHRDTPRLIHEEINSLVRNLKAKLPAEALPEIEAAEAEAVIKAADYLRRPDS